MAAAAWKVSCLRPTVAMHRSSQSQQLVEMWYAQYADAGRLRTASASRFALVSLSGLSSGFMSTTGFDLAGFAPGGSKTCSRRRHERSRPSKQRFEHLVCASGVCGWSGLRDFLHGGQPMSVSAQALTQLDIQSPSSSIALRHSDGKV